MPGENVNVAISETIWLHIVPREGGKLEVDNSTCLLRVGGSG